MLLMKFKEIECEHLKVWLGLLVLFSSYLF
jgi:hypothetical protein